MKKDIKLVIFDWSGVISDDRKPVYEATARIMRQHNKPVPPFEQWQKTITIDAPSFYISQGINKNRDELFNLYEENFNEVIESGLIPEIYPDAQNVLQHLKERGKKIAILSCHPTGNLKKEAERYNLTSFFDLIRSGSKDKAKDLQNICHELGERPEEVLFIGDTIYDIRIAKEVGVNSCGICHGYHLKEGLKNENPDLLLDCLSGLKNWIS